MPPQPNIQESYATMARQRNVSSMQITRENGANDRDGSRNTQLPYGIKESWYRSRISIPAPHLESRNELDEEYLPRGGGFIRVQSNLQRHSSPRWRRKIQPPTESSSDSEEPTPPPMLSSRLRADFRDMSPENAEDSRDRQGVHRTRQNRRLVEAIIGRAVDTVHQHIETTALM